MNGNLLQVIMNKCKIFYGEDLISEESLIEKYAAFIFENFSMEERKISFALHTGSVCFDIVSIVTLTLGSLLYDMPSNDKILASLKVGDMVMYQRARYRWKGTEEIDGKLYLVLEQDGSGKNGTFRLKVPYNQNKHLVRPYYGSSTKTDGRGIRRTDSNRAEFLSYIFNMDVSEVPTEIYSSMVILADRSEFAEISRNVTIEYKCGKRISLLDIAPASYYTDNETGHQFGRNLTKAEPVLKVAGRIGIVRDIALDKQKKIVGLLVIGNDTFKIDESEMSDLLHRKIFHFIHVMAPIRTGEGEQIINLYNSAAVFACTKEFLDSYAKSPVVFNTLTKELSNQVENISGNAVHFESISDGWDWDTYKHLRNLLDIIRHSNWDDIKKEDFLLLARSLISLFNTAVFTMKSMESEIESGHINASVISPNQRILELNSIALLAGSVKEQCTEVASILEKKYRDLETVSPKRQALKQYIKDHRDLRVAIIVPKAYYAELVYRDSGLYLKTEGFQKFICTTANKFDANQKYDAVIVIGDFVGKRFNPLLCFSTKTVDVLLYECEVKSFSIKKKNTFKTEQRLNRKNLKLGDDILNVPEITEDFETEKEVKLFSDLDNYLDGLNNGSFRNLISKTNTGLHNGLTAEVEYAGRFVTGEQIFFSKYYSAVVFDPSVGSVKEITADKLVAGDIIVFAKRDDYTRDIVDFILSQLREANRLPSEVVLALDKAQHWKKVLRDYKKRFELSYRDLTKELKKCGAYVQEVAVRQWLYIESHIVGPRTEKTIEQIAELTRDQELLRNPNDCFEACRIVRHERREILELIGKAINDRLAGNMPQRNSVLEVVYENVGNLSETMELESIFQLGETAYVTMSLVNRPICDNEV